MNMRYESKEDLPETLRDILPEKAQETYLDAYQRAWNNYQDERGGEMGREGVAHRAAMKAVENEYIVDKTRETWVERDSDTPT